MITNVSNMPGLRWGRGFKDSQPLPREAGGTDGRSRPPGERVNAASPRRPWQVGRLPWHQRVTRKSAGTRGDLEGGGPEGLGHSQGLRLRGDTQDWLRVGLSHTAWAVCQLWLRAASAPHLSSGISGGWRSKSKVPAASVLGQSALPAADGRLLPGSSHRGLGPPDMNLGHTHLQCVTGSMLQEKNLTILFHKNIQTEHLLVTLWQKMGRRGWRQR